jgi:L-histidine Nalpha-methyltransferase
MNSDQQTSAHGVGDTVEIIDVGGGTNDFAADVRAGLMSSPKVLSPRYFYDNLGSILFEAICGLPEYYGKPIRLVELGCGAATKTRHVIDATLLRQPVLDYLPIDIDSATLRATARKLAAEYGALRIAGIAASFEDAIQNLAGRIADDGDRLTCVLFLGSTIGNIEPDAQRILLGSLRRVLRAGDARRDSNPCL